jgi:hypothetical protein
VRFGQLADRLPAALQCLQHRTAGWIRQCGKHRVKRIATRLIFILNHVDKYGIAGRQCQPAFMQESVSAAAHHPAICVLPKPAFAPGRHSPENEGMKIRRTHLANTHHVLKLAVLAILPAVVSNVAMAQIAAPLAAGSARADESPAASEERTSPARRQIEFSPENIAKAFDYIDRNDDGNISREEASGIRGVARNFDRADVDKSGSLSRKEFENAMNRAKSR